MPSVSISNAVAQRLHGVDFTGTCDGAEQRFRVERQDLEDLDFNELHNAEGLLQAFERHKGHIADVAAKCFVSDERPALVVLNRVLS